MELFDNINKLLKDELLITIKKNSKVSIAAAYFSIYAYAELKKQLEKVDHVRFLFTSPTFTAEKEKKEKREFYIPKMDREHNLYGTEFEIRLKNEMTQKAIAKECAEWIKNKVTFKSNNTGDNIMGFMNVQNYNDEITYYPITGFTTVDLGCDRGNNRFNYVNKFESPFSIQYITLFDEIWNDDDKLEDVTDT
ncbi:MAG: hypothetical protein KHY19_13595, partial [Coprobacillus cateniformis]|nr:hypothetical protein [Coprobacillus cateniformis]